MRLFVNLLYEFKKTEKLSELLARLEKVMAENQWEQQRIFFHFSDINDATTEARTPHYALIKAFPQIKPYWRSALDEYLAEHPYEKTVPNAHNFSYLSNFPGRQSGQPIFPPTDKNIDFSLIKDIFAKIPRPCTFYSSLAVFDGINWSGNDNLSPAMDWLAICGKSEQEDWEDGYWPKGMDFDEICPFYQSNSIRIGKRFDMEPEMTIQIEVYPNQGIDGVEKVEKIFEKYFGMPIKRYTRAVYPWEEREHYHERTRKMEELFTHWSKQIHQESLQRQEKKEVHAFNKKTVSRSSLKKQFYQNNGLEHYVLSRWDDKSCYCKVLDHNYHLEIGISMNLNPPKADQRHIDNNELYVKCIGCNFELSDRLSVEDFFDSEKDTAGILAFELWQRYLTRFEKEVVPELFLVFGPTSKEFLCDSRRFTRGNDETIGMKYIEF